MTNEVEFTNKGQFDPCPVCGSTAIIENESRRFQYAEVQCTGCLQTSRSYYFASPFADDTDSKMAMARKAAKERWNATEGHK